MVPSLHYVFERYIGSATIPGMISFHYHLNVAFLLIVTTHWTEMEIVNGQVKLASLWLETTFLDCCIATGYKQDLALVKLLKTGAIHGSHLLHLELLSVVCMKTPSMSSIVSEHKLHKWWSIHNIFLFSLSLFLQQFS